RVLAGSAGLARQLALVLAPGADRVLAHQPASGPILVVAGSRHDTTARQVEAMRQAAYPVVALAQDHLDDPMFPIDDVIERVSGYLASGRSAILTTSGLEPSSSHPSFVVARLAEIASAGSVRELLAGLVLTGGDVAAGILSRLGATSFRLGGEIRPAMPWGILDIGNGRSLPVVTKAGSFGEDDALLAAVRSLEARQH
ncbi:MAG TPA: nucleotide-binding domain containing protein, partial [Thermomicrobiales bacterium]|nr:nucleotide-binding domain containing protein [Thermomicrobiales bacterium]